MVNKLVNLKLQLMPNNFFKERGYDLSQPELIPNSIFKPEKQLKARAQAKSASKKKFSNGGP